MATPNSQVLPQKEAAVFKTIVKFYETKQYKKALKSADLEGLPPTSPSVA